MALFGIAPIILLNGISFVVSAITEFFIAVPLNEKKGVLSIKTIIKDVFYGGKLSITLPLLNGFMLTSILCNVLGSGIQAMLLPLSLTKGLTLEEYGIFLSGISAVGIVASFVIGVLKMMRVSKFNVMIYMFVLSHAFIIGSMAFSNKWLYMGLFILSTFANIMANSIFNASFMIAIPQENRATIFGFMASCGSLGAALSTMIYGFLGEYISLTVVTVIGSLLIIFVFIGFKRTKTKEISDLFNTL